MARMRGSTTRQFGNFVVVRSAVVAVVPSPPKSSGGTMTPSSTHDDDDDDDDDDDGDGVMPRSPRTDAAVVDVPAENVPVRAARLLRKRR